MNEWISVKDRLPDDLQEVIIAWVNHDPPSYYGGIKDIPTTGAGVFYHGTWYWYSQYTTDLIAEYGHLEQLFGDYRLDEALEVTHWMPLPKPPTDGGPE